MAYTKKNNATNNVTTKVKEEIAVNNAEVIEEYVPEPRKYNPEDLIPCRSMVSGGLYIEGDRSKFTYSWADYGDVNDVEYRDLIYMVRTNGNKSIYEPRIIVEDEEFINQNPSLKKFYDSLYTTTDLIGILDLPENRMKEVVESLPIGCKNALKGIVSTMIDDNRLDSIGKIKTLDSIFGTNMLLTLVRE